MANFTFQSCNLFSVAFTAAAPVDVWEAITARNNKVKFSVALIVNKFSLSFFISSVPPSRYIFQLMFNANYCLYCLLIFPSWLKIDFFRFLKPHFKQKAFFMEFYTSINSFKLRYRKDLKLYGTLWNGIQNLCVARMNSETNFRRMWVRVNCIFLENL